MNKLKQIKELENGKGIQYLLDSANKIFNNPIIMYDTYYNLIAFTDVPFDDPVWSELVTTGTFSLDTKKFFVKEKMVEFTANAETSTIIKTSNLKYARIFGYILNEDKIKVAILVMYELNTPFDKESNEAFEALEAIIENEIKSEDYYVSFGRVYHEDIINKLLDRVTVDPAPYTPHVQVLYDGFEDYIFVAVVDVSQSNIHRNNREYFKYLLRGLYRICKFAVYGEYVVMLMSLRHREFDKKLFLNISNNIFEKKNLFVGISEGFENIYELRDNYDKAVRLLKEGIKRNSGQRIFM